LLLFCSLRNGLEITVNKREQNGDQPRNARGNFLVENLICRFAKSPTLKRASAAKIFDGTE
jgi:hypothetical protein